jgi:P27 family predicted phage terminase small subunit
MPRLVNPADRIARGDHRVRAIAPRSGPIPPAPEGIDATAWASIYHDGPHLTARDARLVALLLRLYADAAALRMLLDAEGRIVRGSRGTPAAHPAARMLRDAEAAIVAVSSALVLTPATRARAILPDAPTAPRTIDHFRERLESSFFTPAPEGQGESMHGHEQTPRRPQGRTRVASIPPETKKKNPKQ